MKVYLVVRSIRDKEEILEEGGEGERGEGGCSQLEAGPAELRLRRPDGNGNDNAGDYDDSDEEGQE